MESPATDGVSRRSFVGTGGLAGGLAAMGLLPRVVAAGQEADDDPVAPAPAAAAANGPPGGVPPAPAPLAISGVVPTLTAHADLASRRSESGIGALAPWADRLWFVTYLAHTKTTGSGTGLYSVDDRMTLTRHRESVPGTYANRMVHAPSMQLVIGPHVIDARRKIRTFDSLVDHRLTATMTHLKDSDNKVYFLTMEGLLFEADVHTLRTTHLFDVKKELLMPEGAYSHFKGGYTGAGRVVVANNTYSEPDQLGHPSGGRLGEWDGQKWTTLAGTAFCEVTGRPSPAHAHILASGWDRASVILKAFAAGKWHTYRLPAGSHCHDHMWYTEWPRIREVETERLLMDMHGLFYELSPLAYGGHLWGVKPICQHLRMVPDFCTWRGMLVLAGDQVTAVGGNLEAGEPQSNLWFGKTDDLWSFGKPQGWGGPWRDTPVQANQPSDPFLMTGFDKKCLHLTSDAGITCRIEVDFLGNGTWKKYAEFAMPAEGYFHHEFPAGFSAHWVRLVAREACTATAQFVYT